MFEKWTEDQLLRVARHITEAVVSDVLAGVLPVDAVDWSDFHAYVDANQYALDAVEELKVRVEEGRDPHGMSWSYLLMADAEEVAWAAYQTTPRLKELRGLVRQGTKVRYVSEDDNEDYGTLTVQTYRSYRHGRKMVVDLYRDNDTEDLVVAEVTDLRPV